MERIIWTHLSPEPFYVFDDAHIVHFWDDGVGIHRTQEWYRDADTWLSPFGGPHLYLKALPLSFYKSIVLGDRLPISLTLEGGDLADPGRPPGDQDRLAAHASRRVRHAAPPGSWSLR